MVDDQLHPHDRGESSPGYISKTERTFGVIYRCHGCQNAVDDWREIDHNPGCE